MLNEFLLLTFSFRHCVILLNPTPRKMFCALLLSFFFFLPPYLCFCCWDLVVNSLISPCWSSKVFSQVCGALFDVSSRLPEELTHISLGELAATRISQSEAHRDFSLIFLSQALSWFHLSYGFLLPDLHILSIKSHKEREAYFQAKPCLCSTVLPLGSFPFSGSLG